MTPAIKNGKMEGFTKFGMECGAQYAAEFDRIMNPKPKTAFDQTVDEIKYQARSKGPYLLAVAGILAGTYFGIKAIYGTTNKIVEQSRAERQTDITDVMK